MGLIAGFVRKGNEGEDIFGCFKGAGLVGLKREGKKEGRVGFPDECHGRRLQ